MSPTEPVTLVYVAGLGRWQFVGLSAIPVLDQLTALVGSNWACLQTGVDAAALTRMTRLEHLELHVDVHAADRELVRFHTAGFADALESFTQMTFLSLQDDQFAHGVAEMLAAAGELPAEERPFRKLRELRLRMYDDADSVPDLLDVVGARSTLAGLKVLHVGLQPGPDPDTGNYRYMEPIPDCNIGDLREVFDSDREADPDACDVTIHRPRRAFEQVTYGHL